MLQINQQTMSSREIAELTGKEHKNVMADIRRIEQELAGLISQPGSYKDANNQERTMLLLNKDNTLLLMSGYSVALRKKIIDRWQELENQQQQKLPTTYLSALEQLVESVKENQRLELINNKLMHVDKTYTASEIAKELGLTSATALNMLLNHKGVQFKQNGTWLPYAKYSQLGYFEIKQSDYNGHIKYDRRFTQKGREFVLNFIGAQ